MIQGARLFEKDKSNKVRFRAMMESGLLVDEEAEIVQTQVIAHKARASIRNRPTVPLYHLTEEDRDPVWRENLIVETGLSPPPGTDSRYTLEDSHNLHVGIRSGAVEVNPDSLFKSNLFTIVMHVAAVIIFLVCGVLAGQNVQPAVVTGNTTAQPEQVEERVTHGPANSDSIKAGEETGTEATGEGAGEGARGPVESSVESVVSGGVEGDGDTAPSVP